MCAEHPVVTIEDPFDQNDWDNWSKLTARVGEATQIVGDDLTVTNIDKIKEVCLSCSSSPPVHVTVYCI